MATKKIAWNTGSGNITLTYQGQGNGTINVSSDENNLGSARSQTITIKTTAGGLVTKNVTIRQAVCPFPVGSVKSFSYTGDYQEVELPAGQYKLQCWGAQGGSNDTNSSYGITAKAGGKGGYSEGIITLSQKTTVRVYVGGQGSSSARGFNGGGSTTGTSQYNTSIQDYAFSEDGFFANNGRFYDRSDWKHTPKIPVQEGEVFIYSGGMGAAYSSIIGYDSEDNISVILAGGDYTNQEVTIPSGIVSIIAQSRSSTLYAIILTSELGYSKMGGGGGATDIRHDGSLYSRMIVAGGGSGGAMCYKRVTATSWTNFASGTATEVYTTSDTHGTRAIIQSISEGEVIRVKVTVSDTAHLNRIRVGFRNSSGANLGRTYITNDTYSSTLTAPANTADIIIFSSATSAEYDVPFTYIVEKQTSSTSTSTDSQVGYVGGGTEGGGYSSTYKGKQTSAGSGGSFGLGANQSASDYRYCSGAGGGGWYGGGAAYSNSPKTCCRYSGGGSGFVNTAANAGNRPLGYFGLELDSGTTYAGDTSFPNTAGTGNETGHSGNGYAKITRIT